MSVRKPRCSQCGDTDLTLMEETIGMGQWSSDEWKLDDADEVIFTGEGWSDSHPTGRWFLECEGCGYRWTRRTKRKSA